MRRKKSIWGKATFGYAWCNPVQYGQQTWPGQTPYNDFFISFFAAVAVYLVPC